MTKFWLALAVAAALSSTAMAKDTRSFHMGFTTWPYAATPEAVAGTVAFIRANGDIVAEQIDNTVPWTALIEGHPWPQKTESEVTERAARWRDRTPLLVSTTPLSVLRDTIANDAATGAPPQLGPRPFAGARVRTAYVAYCKRLIELFKPTYFAYAIETNEFLANAPAQAEDYARFIAGVRRDLKRAYPKLAIGQTVSVHNVLDPEKGGLAAQAPKLRALLQGDHFAGISYYPFLRMHTGAQDFRSAFDTMRTLFAGPLGVTETGEIAEPLHLRALNFTLPGSIQLQRDYTAVLLAEAERRKFRFVVYWTHRDYDELLKIFPEPLRELGGIWLRTGMLQANGTARPAHTIWRRWLAKRLKRN